MLRFQNSPITLISTSFYSQLTRFSINHQLSFLFCRSLIRFGRTFEFSKERLGLRKEVTLQSQSLKVIEEISHPEVGKAPHQLIVNEDKIVSRSKLFLNEF
jgi:hypothetical protein